MSVAKAVASPIVSAVKWVGKTVSGLVGDVVHFVGDVFHAIKASVAALFKLVGDWASKLWHLITKAVMGCLSALLKMFTAIMKSLGVDKMMVAVGKMFTGALHSGWTAAEHLHEGGHESSEGGRTTG